MDRITHFWHTNGMQVYQIGTDDHKRTRYTTKQPIPSRVNFSRRRPSDHPSREIRCINNMYTYKYNLVSRLSLDVVYSNDILWAIIFAINYNVHRYVSWCFAGVTSCSRQFPAKITSSMSPEKNFKTFTGMVFIHPQKSK